MIVASSWSLACCGCRSYCSAWLRGRCSSQMSESKCRSSSVPSISRNTVSRVDQSTINKNSLKGFLQAASDSGFWQAGILPIAGVGSVSRLFNRFWLAAGARAAQAANEGSLGRANNQHFASLTGVATECRERQGYQVDGTAHNGGGQQGRTQQDRIGRHGQRRGAFIDRSGVAQR